MRCPACGARNGEAATWCTQCYADLRTSGATGGEPVGPVTGVSDRGSRDVRTVDGEVEWRCSTCGSWTPLASGRCATCDAPRRGFGEVAPPPVLGSDMRGRLLLASLLFPGLGHLVARRVGTGVARLVLAGSWLVGALVVVVGAGGGAGRIPAVPLLLGVAVLWVGSARDAVALVDGGRELLRPRVLSWLTGAVLAGLLLTSFLVAGSASPAG